HQLESPCAFACVSVACPKVDDFYDSCQEKYADVYTFEEECSAVEIEESTHKYTLKEPAFIVGYVWTCASVFFVLTWCAYNQRLSPVSGSTEPFQPGETRGNNVMEKNSWQTGYKIHPVGAAINIFTVITLLAIQAMLMWLTVQYYVQQEAIPSLTMYFSDEEQSYFSWSDRLLTILYSGRKLMNFIFSSSNTFGCPQTAKGHFEFCKVHTNVDGSKFIVFRFRRYNLSKDGNFTAGIWNVDSTVKSIAEAHTSKGLSSEEVTARQRVVGLNTIQMRKPNCFKTLQRELNKGFYTYQLYIMWTWACLWYYYMALVWLFVIGCGAIAVTFFQYRNEVSLFQLSKQEGMVEVVRDGRYQSVPHQELVPGDVVLVTQRGNVFADMVVVASETALIDESTLTGEANPIGKTAIDPMEGTAPYSQKKHKQHTLLCGTSIMETHATIAVVTQTASFSARGELIRSIMSYQRHEFKFDKEIPIVMIILLLFAIFGFILSNFFTGENIVYGFFYGMWVIAAALPPLLPTVFTVSVGISDDRLLRNRRIACTNSENILVAGKVDRALFDKTGTLTRQGLEFLSSRDIHSWGSEENPIVEQQMAVGMAVCHSLTKLEESGELIGNPVDRVMFEASGGELLQDSIKDKNGNELKVVRHCDFDHSRMTQSVVVQDSNGKLTVFVKGSGENISKLCIKESLPSDFEYALRESSKQGIYQISMASKSLDKKTDVHSLTRDEIESSIEFQGVINFKNTMKDESAGVIRDLKDGSVPSHIVTGDSVLNGICAAKECGIIDKRKALFIGLKKENAIVWSDENEEPVEDLPSIQQLTESHTQLAISGEAFSLFMTLDPLKATEATPLIKVFGRCTPYDKVMVVNTFIKAGSITMFCGDGGNDVGSLKAAHVGIALSDAEASMVAPFTSLDKDIRACVEVLKEGRCALTSALASYKFLLMYGQLSAVNLLAMAYLGILASEWCWVFMDGIWTIPLAFTLPLAKAANKLSPTRPTASLFGLHTLSSWFGVYFLNLAFMVGSFFYLFGQDWFQCRMWESDDISNVLVLGDNYESETLYLMTGAQFIGSAMVYNFGYEFRQAWWRNYLFAILSIGFFVFQIYIALVPGEASCFFRVNCSNENVVRGIVVDLLPIQNPFNTTVMPESFQNGIVGLMVANLVVITIYEYFIVNGIRRYHAAKRLAKEAAKDGWRSTERRRSSALTMDRRRSSALVMMDHSKMIAISETLKTAESNSTDATEKAADESV
ncbi:MAG: hypothetical protein SGILL_006969, partial [Bacillariaceae sp.]